MATITLSENFSFYNLINVLVNNHNNAFISIKLNKLRDTNNIIPKLTLANGNEITSFIAIIKYLALTSDNAFPEQNDIFISSKIDQWLDIANQMHNLIEGWIKITDAKILWKNRSDIKSEIIECLNGIERRLHNNTFLVNEKISLADLTLGILIKKLFEEIIGIKDQNKYLSIIRWLKTICSTYEKSLIGSFQPSKHENGWIVLK